MKNIFAVSLTLSASFNCFALTIEQAEFAISIASSRVNSSEYNSAFNEMGWMLNNESTDIQRLAKDFLKKYPAVANSRISLFNEQYIRESSCKSGNAELSRRDLEKQIHDLAPFAEPEITSNAINKVDQFFSSVDNLNQISDCKVNNTIRESESKRAHAELVDKATKRAPSLLSDMKLNELCVNYGKIVRGDYLDDFSPIKNPSELFEKEFKKRRVNVDKKLIKAAQLRIGASQCTMYASWGLPTSQNSSTGAWGVHTQNIYGDFGPYVYTENGKISSWQKATTN